MSPMVRASSVAVSVLCLLALAVSGCQSIPLGSRGPMVRDITPENNATIVLDEVTVPTEQLIGSETTVPVPGTEPAAEGETVEEEPVAPAPVPDGAVVMVDADGDGIPEAPPVSSPRAALAQFALADEMTLAGPEYRIRPGDVVEFQSFDDEFLNRPDVRVRYDGYVSLPLVPDVRLEGLTRQEAIDVIREAYKSEFRDPRLTLRVVENTRSYYIMGDIRSPNQYPYTQPLSVIDAINRAGGLRGTVDREQSYMSMQGQLVKAFVIRRAGEERQTFMVDLRNIISSGPHASETLVLPDDIIYVPEGLNLVYVLGESRRSDVFTLTQGMTLLQLLAVAGGPNFATARLREVVLMRPLDDTRTRVLLLDVNQMLRTGQSVQLEPGDMIYIPRKRLIQAQEFVSRFTGTVLPVMNLYRQAYDTYYTRDRYDAIFNQRGGTNNTLAILQGLRDISNVLTPLATIP